LPLKETEAALIGRQGPNSQTDIKVNAKLKRKINWRTPHQQINQSGLFQFFVIFNSFYLKINKNDQKLKQTTLVC
jgi:hypothetical protein